MFIKQNCVDNVGWLTLRNVQLEGELRTSILFCYNFLLLKYCIYKEINPLNKKLSEFKQVHFRKNFSKSVNSNTKKKFGNWSFQLTKY